MGQWRGAFRRAYLLLLVVVGVGDDDGNHLCFAADGVAHQVQPLLLAQYEYPCIPFLLVSTQVLRRPCQY
jgi:hypothetical protein